MIILKALFGLIAIEMISFEFELLEQDKKATQKQVSGISITSFRNKLKYRLSQADSLKGDLTMSASSPTTVPRLFTSRTTDFGGRVYLTLEVSSKVANLLLTSNSRNLEENLMLTLDNEGRVIDYYSLIAE